MREALLQLYESLIRNLGGPIGIKLRLWYYRNKFKSFGKNCIIEAGVHITNPKWIILGDNCWIDKNTILIAGAFTPKERKFAQKGINSVSWGELIIGDGCHIAPFSIIQAHGGVKIGKNVTVASGSKIYSLSHHYRNLNNEKDIKRYSFSTMAAAEDQFLIVGNIIIGDNAAVGINSVILPGTEVPNGTWIGVLSTPTKANKLIENTIYKNN